MISNIQKKLGEKIKNAREKAKLTQEEVAKKAGLRGNYFAKIERGEINPTFKTLHSIKKALNIEANDIFPS